MAIVNCFLHTISVHCSIHHILMLYILQYHHLDVLGLVVIDLTDGPDIIGEFLGGGFS